MFVLAARCVACDEILDTPSRGTVCDTCWRAVPWDDAEGVGVGLRPTRPGAPAIVSAARYDGPMPAIIHAFKYHGHQSLGPRLASALRDHPQLHIDEVDLVVPVPLHPWRRFTRGFNQAERIARHLGPPVLHALRRRRWTASQTALSADERRQNLRRSIALNAWTERGRGALRDRLVGRRVLLVDDVVTTGATLAACAAVLRHAGAREVRAATAAWTPRV